MARWKLPPVIHAGFDKFITSDGVRAVMDGNGTMKGRCDLVTIIMTHSAELAPPQGNYVGSR
jgi:hypothetical protein